VPSIFTKLRHDHELKSHARLVYNSPHALDVKRPAICDRDGFRRNRECLRILHPRKDAQHRFLCGFLAYREGFQVLLGVLEHRSPQRLVSSPSDRWSCRIRSNGNFPVLLSIRNPLVVGSFDSSYWHPIQTNPSDTQTTNSRSQSEWSPPAPTTRAAPYPQSAPAARTWPKRSFFAHLYCSPAHSMAQTRCPTRHWRASGTARR
jgi:hypothetical protein